MGWMTALIAANLIGIGSNLDNCGTGMAYGSSKIRFPPFVNAIVNIVGFGTALIGAYAGTIISQYLSVRAASWTACVVLVCIGLFFWYSAYVKPIFFKHKDGDMKTPTWKEGILLGFALSFTNVASGFSATVSSASTIWPTTIAIAVWGYVMIWLGNVVGIGILARILGKYSSFSAGLLLILVGLYQVH